MTGKDFLIEYAKEHTAEEIYDFLKNLFNESTGWTDSKLYIIEWLNSKIICSDFGYDKEERIRAHYGRETVLL